LAVDLLNLLFYIIIFLYCLALNYCHMIYFVVLCPVLCLQSSSSVICLLSYSGSCLVNHRKVSTVKKVLF